MEWVGEKTNGLLAVIVLLVSHLAMAHEQKAVVTTIEANSRTGMLEVVHRFSLHDVEHAVRDMHWPATDILASTEDQARFAQFVAGQFSLQVSGPPPSELLLTLVGQELEGRYLWVYQESPAPEDLSELVVSSTILRRVWPVHQHLVNVTIDQSPRSLVFKAGVSRLAVASESADQTIER